MLYYTIVQYNSFCLGLSILLFSTSSVRVHTNNTVILSFCFVVGGGGLGDESSCLLYRYSSLLNNVYRRYR